MKKVIFVTLIIFFIGRSISISAEKPCSQFNYWTENWKYKKCMSELKEADKIEKNNFLTNMNKKYKNLRKKVAPKTGEEYWKDFRKKKNNEN